MIYSYQRRTGSQEPGPKAGRSAAFTLLEVILALGIVTMLILMVANMFQEVSVSWNLGTQSAERNTAGRAAVDFIARELAQAVAGPIEAHEAHALPAIRFQVIGDNSLLFVALTGNPYSAGRALRSAYFHYDIAASELKYYRETGAFDPYGENPPATAGQRLIPNVTDFQVSAYDHAGGAPLAGDYDATILPVYVDLYLEVLSNDDMKKWQATGNDPDFKNRNARRYTTRVYFNNRMGWAGKPE